MIPIARNTLFCLFSNPNSFVCNPNVLSFHFFPTARAKRLIIPSPAIYDVLVHKHQFSPELAGLASSRLPKFRRPKRDDSVLSLLKENSFTITQLQKIIIYNPRILGFTIEGFKSRFTVFQDLGLSSKEFAKIISSNQAILHSCMASKVIPKLSMLKGLLGSNEEVARLFKKCAWFLTNDLEKTLMPNVEILKSCSIPMERILQFLYIQPRCFVVKPNIMRKSVDRAIEYGVPQTSVAFIQAANIFTFTSKWMWEVKLETLRNLGFSDDDIVTMFRKQPNVLLASVKKMKNVMELVLATRKYNISNIVTCPMALVCSIEKRLDPRKQILRLLESRNLIEKWPPLSSAIVYTDDRFFDRFIRSHFDKIGEEHIPKIYDEGRKR